MMKAVPSPVSASKAASRTRPRLPSTTTLPRHLAAVDLARTQQVARADGRGPIVAAHGCPRVAQHTRRSSGSRPCIFGAKINKPTHLTKVGSWLESVDACEPPPLSPAYPPPCPSPRPRNPDANTPSFGATQIVRQPGSPRTPLADITPFVLAAESAASALPFNAVGVDLRPQQRIPRPAQNLAGAIDMLTADDAKQLLLLSAQSNISLAAAVKQVAFARTQRPPTKHVRESYLADTFRFEHPMSANV